MIPNKKHFVSIFIRLVFLLFSLVAYSQSNHKIDSLKKVIAFSPNDTNKVKNYIYLGNKYQNTQLDSFFDVSTKAYQLADSLHFSWGILRSKYNIGIYYVQKESIDSAKKIFSECIRIAEENNDIMYVARLHTALGNAHFYVSNVDSAEAEYWLALYYQKQIKDSVGYINTYTQLGNVYSYYSDYNKSYVYYLKALKIAEQINNLSKIALANKFIADLLSGKGEVDLAMVYQLKALKVFEQLGDKANEGNCYEILSKTSNLKHNYKEAEQYALKALSIYQAINFDMRSMVCLSDLANIYTNIGDYENAIEYENKALQINQKLKMDLYKGLSFQNLGNIYFKMGDKPSSTLMLLKSIEIFKQINSTYDLGDSYSILASVYSKSNNYKEAYRYQLMYDSINGEINKQEKEKVFADMNVKYETEKKEKELKDRDWSLKEKNEQLKTKNIFIYTAFSGVLLLIIIISLLIIISKRNQLRLRVETEKNKLELQNKLMELEQKALRSQMNPHFIFNALNSIQSFISSNNTEEATRLLAKFAKLMRLILDNSRTKIISLENEVNMLKYYLELQQLSYGNKFNFKIEIDPLIDIENIGIPPMLIQPFIENAIVHGIANKSSKGNIILRIKSLGEYIQIEIEDDGIGREKALLQKQQLNSIHKSVGLLITEERIHIFNEENKQQIKVDVLDLKDNDGNALGTKGVLNFPLQYLYN